MTTPTEAAMKAAQAVTDDLFINGFGEHAERLVLWRDTTKQDLGGLCPGVVRDRIASAIDAAVAAAREACAATKLGRKATP